MAATLSLDTITSSGTNIEIPTGKVLKIADAGALKINDIAITTGAQGVISKTATYPIVAGDFTGKSSLIVFVDVSAGTSTAADITLPAAADFGTCAIHVVSTAAHGSGNSIAIKLGAVEQYTLYKKGDHCEFVSDGTNVFRTGNEHATIRGSVALTADWGVAGNSHHDIFNAVDAANYSVEEDIGSGWSITNDDWTVPYTGRYWFGGHFPASGYINGFLIYKDGTPLTQSRENEIQYGGATQSNLYINLTVGEVITWWVATTDSTTATLAGDAAKDELQVMWWMVRRD